LSVNNVQVIRSLQAALPSGQPLSGVTYLVSNVMGQLLALVQGDNNVYLVKRDLTSVRMVVNGSQIMNDRAKSQRLHYPQRFAYLAPHKVLIITELDRATIKMYEVTSE